MLMIQNCLKKSVQLSQYVQAGPAARFSMFA